MSRRKDRSARAPFDPSLAGPPSRYSPAFGNAELERFEGLVKLRLGHARFGSILLPELMFVQRGGWHFYQPSFFGPPILGFNIEPGLHVARFSIDVGGPRETDPTRVIVEIRSDGFVRGYVDGAQLYRCIVEAPSRLLRYASGKCLQRDDEDFDIHLSHITNPAAYAAIRTSGELRSSRWNLQGTRELVNVAYVYLTSLPAVRSEEDLRRIAMSSDGAINFQTTSSRPREETLKLTVYRESTKGRTARLPVSVASDLLAPPHLLIHRPLGDLPYYEVVGPEIYRIGVQPGMALAYANGAATIDPGSLKRFSYVVVGDAATLAGLAAPYDEEETREVVHVETLDAGLDLFDFWQARQNSDQVSDRTPEPRFLSPPR
ncbi:hypothetical protein [Sphingomonas oryzagri]|uniref:Uncharacterized protein n=1 Tax=Sphingomonas oryzagri TaxID=3042314 RepID=A0ABT6MYG4_9SPHN|nr:hypothetical protein [Sphingomonas oryzagri]MDH7638099.1 hypothetical protein [Sphingomonas oryzagri]